MKIAMPWEIKFFGSVVYRRYDLNTPVHDYDITTPLALIFADEENKGFRWRVILESKHYVNCETLEEAKSKCDEFLLKNDWRLLNDEKLGNLL